MVCASQKLIFNEEFESFVEVFGFAPWRVVSGVLELGTIYNKTYFLQIIVRNNRASICEIQILVLS